jgi:prepilin-type N-terminal cleavage/methylation domain-containing protein
MAWGKIGTGIAKPLKFRQNHRLMTTLSNKLRSSGQKGFTLIELLVVIAIIALVAGMVVGLAGSSSSKKQRKLTESKLAKIVTAIEIYKIDKGHLPPANQAYNTVSNAHYTSLFYELTGMSVSNRVGSSASFYYPVGVQPGVILTSGDLLNAFAIPGIVNSVKFGGTDRVNSYFEVSNSKDYWVAPNQNQITSVTVPGKDVALLQVAAPSWRLGLTTNYWNYRLNPADGHNPGSYDLWAEIRGKKPGANDKEIIGNWNIRN